MKYRVFNTIKNRYVTDEEAWILKPDGQLAVNEDGDEIFENDLIDFGGEILFVYWNGEAFGWQARKICPEHYKRFPDRDWHYIDLGWIAAEIPCVGKMTTKIIGSIRDNQEYAERISQAYWSKEF